MKTITSISENLEYYEYNDELKLVHLIKEDMFQCKSILDSLKCSDKRTNNWIRNSDTKDLIEGFESMREFAHGLLINEFVFPDNLKRYNGYYIHRLLVNHFAMWANKKYAYKISLILDEYFENIRLKKEVVEKDDCIKQLNENIARLESKIDKQSKKINKQTKKINKQSKKIDNQTKILTEVKHSLTSIADSVVDLNKHITSNLICRYHILLWLDSDNQKKTKASDKVTIKTFVGLIENTPKLSQTDKILLQENVSCSLDSFKQVLANLSDLGFTTNYRNIIVNQFDLELFIVKFKAELIQINTPIKDIHNSLTSLETTVKEQNIKLKQIESTLNIISQFYNLDEKQLNQIENGKLVFKYRNRWRKIKINKNKHKLYVNHGKNDSEIYYLAQEDI